MTAAATPAASSLLFLQVSGPPGGTPIVFLHPSGSNASAWVPHLHALAPHHRCLAVDLPGHRHSRQVGWVSLASTADAVADLIAAQPGGRAHLVGLSLGGSLALTMMARRPEVLDHVVVDGAGALPNRWAWALKAAVSGGSPVLHTRPAIHAMGAALRVSAEDLPSFADGMRAIPPSVFRRAFCQAQDVRITDELLRFDKPVLLVAGEHDPAATRLSNATLAAALPHAAARFMPALGHAWMATRPQLHVEMVRCWIEDQPLPEDLRAEVLCPGAGVPPPASPGRTEHRKAVTQDQRM
jgi:pimeloyl-ACP methyl ester carboxylesterase